jgi:uncharacterized protein (TIGR02594 family)
MSIVDIAKQYIGVREVGGDNKGELVQLFQSAVDGKAQGESWCMGFVQFCIKQVELATNTKSKVFKSEHCLTVWNNSPKELRLEKPEVGCLVIWQFENTPQGHVGIVTKVNVNTIDTIEGNTGTGAAIERNGDGVHARVRSKTGSKQMRVVGYLKVF